MRSQRSMDGSSADGEMSDSSGGATGAKGASAGSNPNALKSIWKKTVNKLIGKMKTVEPTETEHKPEAAAAAAQVENTTEVDPVYSFLKLTSVMPREGTTSVIPGEGHRCCPGSKTDRRLADEDIDDSTYTHSNDPAKCQCPCHLPERLEACHYAWKKAFLINKS